MSDVEEWIKRIGARLYARRDEAVILGWAEASIGEWGPSENLCHANVDTYVANTTGCRAVRGYLYFDQAGLLPFVSIGALPFLTPDERHQILVTWNDKTHDFPREATLHGLVAERAAAQPDAMAAVFRGRSLTCKR